MDENSVDARLPLDLGGDEETLSLWTSLLDIIYGVLDARARRQVKVVDLPAEEKLRRDLHETGLLFLCLAGEGLPIVDAYELKESQTCSS